MSLMVLSFVSSCFQGISTGGASSVMSLRLGIVVSLSDFSSSSKFSRKVVIAAAALITGVGFSRAFEKKKNVAYKVTAGDTLFRLCKLDSGGGALEQVLKLNPKLRKRDGQSLRVGETLLLPARLMRKPPAGKR